MPSPQHPSVLRSPRLWIGTGLIVAVVSTLFALLYVGGNVNPKGNLRDLPVALVNSDKGADAGGKRVNLGDQVVSGIKKNAESNDSFDWQVLSREEADKRLGQGKLYGALVVPKDFTATVTGLTAPQQKQPVRPTLTVLTNQSAGSIGSSMASQANQKAAHGASAQIGKDLLKRANAQGAKLAPAAQLMLADPVTVEVADGHPLGSHSAMGLSAFYYALVLLVCGMLGANVITSQVDTALGYLHSDFGPFRQRMPLQRTSRVRTLAVGSVLMLAFSVVMGSLVEVATVGILDMDASHLGLLWLYSVGTIAVVGLGALALLAAFGTPGMLLSAIIFVAMAVPSSGATVPLEALPGFFRALGEFEPLRQITGGMRSILYYDAQGDAGLTRAWTAMGIALVVAVLFGFGVTRFYDRKGLHRVPGPDEAAEADAAPAPTAV
ncbi:YhgE/Pip domain-containing protein [Streptomyces albireticuli]|uniref:ABC transporter n=1 Tax=Streptomyces albireticuli TaxID=1940 RepID=A0A2A2D579_9ACTN|nr:YhgE/Pip family protein [Streptomyces albireticuli]MCD9145961.1 SNG1 family protein [Streptomyces albireticuli]MCD9194509.1 SNG1 family protein [Streptomyces albireticuli]PAU46671.1 ABC transporter [Streptomyces albireticuli]